MKDRAVLKKAERMFGHEEDRKRRVVHCDYKCGRRQCQHKKILPIFQNNLYLLIYHDTQRVVQSINTHLVHTMNTTAVTNKIIKKFVRTTSVYSFVDVNLNVVCNKK